MFVGPTVLFFASGTPNSLQSPIKVSISTEQSDVCSPPINIKSSTTHCKKSRIFQIHYKKLANICLYSIYCKMLYQADRSQLDSQLGVERHFLYQYFQVLTYDLHRKSYQKFGLNKNI